jgi:transcriptional regulator with XRE-family HTH domain
MSFSGRIYQLRVHFGKSHFGLGKLLGVGSGYFYRLENGEVSNPHKLLPCLLANGINPDWFLTGEGSMTKPQEPEPHGTKAQGADATNHDALRDYFAGQYLVRAAALRHGKDFKAMATDAYRVADAMIEARERRTT